MSKCTVRQYQCYGDHLYYSGTTARVLATANPGWKFNYWLLNGTNVGDINPYALTINDDHNLTAVFEALPVYELNVQLSGSGQPMLPVITTILQEPA